MIAKDAVQQFLLRELRDYAWMKDLTRADLVLELKERLRDEQLPWPFITTPRKHQLVCFLIGMKRLRFLWGLDMGGGKTKLVLDLFRYHRSAGRVSRLLAMVPKKVHIGSWSTSVEQHSDCSFCGVAETSVDRKWECLMDSPEDVVVIDYAGLELALSTKHRDGNVTKWKPDLKKIAQAAAKYDGFAYDEIHHCSSHTALRYKVLQRLTRDAEMVYGMTGTMTGRDPQIMWPQFNLVDKGEALGPTLGMYRAAFFIEKKNFFGGFDYKFDTSRTNDLKRALAHSSIQYKDREFNDLPELVQEPPIVFRLPGPQRSLYTEVARGQIIEGVRVPTDGVFHRMRELASGFVRTQVNGVDVVRWFEDNPKEDLLVTFLEDLPPDRKAIVFFDYTPSGAHIIKILDRMKMGHLLLDGTVKDSLNVERKFRDDPKKRVAVINNASGAEGINAQSANYVFYYELPTSALKWMQGLKRAHRDGQMRRVTVRYALGKGTVEEKLFGYLQQGKDMLTLMRSGKTGKSLFDVSEL